MNPAISAYNKQQDPPSQLICNRLAELIQQFLPQATHKVWHGHPVWFINENPIVGYARRKATVQVLFWSGQSFTEPGLEDTGSFKAAQKHYSDVSEIHDDDLKRWLKDAALIQWDYKNIVKRRGQLERLDIS